MAHGARQMDLLIAGMPSIDLEDWQTNTAYMGFFNKDSPEVQWFWEIVRDEFSATEHAKLMHFTTGSASVPASGFSTLSGYGGGTCRFTLEGRTDQGPEHLPTAATCFNRLRMPRYTSREQMLVRLKTAIMGVQQFHEVLCLSGHTHPPPRMQARRRSLAFGRVLPLTRHLHSIPQAAMGTPNVEADAAAAAAMAGGTGP